MLIILSLSYLLVFSDCCISTFPQINDLSTSSTTADMVPTSHKHHAADEGVVMLVCPPETKQMRCTVQYIQRQGGLCQ